MTTRVTSTPRVEAGSYISVSEAVTATGVTTPVTFYTYVNETVIMNAKSYDYGTVLAYDPYFTGNGTQSSATFFSRAGGVGVYTFKGNVTGCRVDGASQCVVVAPVNLPGTTLVSPQIRQEPVTVPTPGLPVPEGVRASVSNLPVPASSPTTVVSLPVPAADVVGPLA